MQSQERLETILLLQATGNDVIQWASSERFDDFVQGFYVRVKIDKKDTWGIGRVEGVRLGAPYQLGTSNIKDCTKYLLVYRPPAAPLIISLNDVSNEPICMGELESWDANLAILQLPLAHKLDIEAAKCKREEMGTPEVVVKLRKTISPKHLDAHKRISLNVDLERKKVKKIGDSIAMFERKAQEQTHSQGTIQRRVALIKAQQGSSPRASSSDSMLSPTARDIALSPKETPAQEAPAPKEPKPKSGSAIISRPTTPKETKPEPVKAEPAKPEVTKAEPAKPEVIKAEPKPKSAEIELPFEIKLRHVEKEPKLDAKAKLSDTPSPEPTKPEPKAQEKASKSGSGSPKSESAPNPTPEPTPAPSPAPEVSKPELVASEAEVPKEEQTSVNTNETSDKPEKESKSEPKSKPTEKSNSDTPSAEPVQETKPEPEYKPEPNSQEKASKSGSGSPKSEPDSAPSAEPNPASSTTEPAPEPSSGLTAKTPRSARTPRSPKSPKTKTDVPLKATKDGVLPPSSSSLQSPNRTGSSETVATLSHTDSSSNLDSSRGTPRRARAKSVESKQALEINKPAARPRSIELSDPVPGIEPASPPESKKANYAKSGPDSPGGDHLDPQNAVKQAVHQTSPASTKKKGKLESVTKKITQLATQPNFSKPFDSPELPEKVSKQKSLEPKSPESKPKKGFLSKKRFIRRHDKSDRAKSNSSDEVQSPSSPVVASSGDEKDLAHIPFIADEHEEEFLEDDPVNSPKQDARKPHSRSGSISISVDSAIPPQEKKLSQDRLAPAETKGPSSLSMPVHSVDEVAPAHTAPSRHKRTSSLELTVTSFPVENITGRDHRSGTVVLLGAPLLSRFSIPVSLLSEPGSAREWESKKMRSIEKQARLHDKEKTALLLEESAFREKFPLDSKEKFAALDREQFAEREAMNRKIIQDKANLQEQQLQERRNLERVLKKAHEQATLELTQEHDKTEKRTNADFEKQITSLKKANRGEKIGGEQLLERLQQAHKAHLMRNHHTKELAELKLVHKHELENLKKRQELLKRQTQVAQKLERDILIRQLSLSQKLLRQKRWLSLDLLREEQNTLRSFQERRHQLEIRQESELAQVALKLIQKQQVLESATITKHHSSAKKKESAEYQKAKRALKANHLQAVRKAQKDKSLARDDLKAKLDDLQLKFKQELETLATQHGGKSPETVSGSDGASISAEKIASRHEEQLDWFKEERKRRRDLILLHHQTDKNALQEEIELARKALESQLKSSVKEFEEEEITMKETFTVANENALWELQQLQWREIQENQKSAHDQQQKVLARMQDEIKATPYVNEEERTQAEEQMNVEQLQLEKQQEQEMLILEQERVQEQEQLKVQLEEEKKEVMSVRIVEDELTLRQEYIRKISNDTGLSEELIAKQLDIIGMPSFMF